MKWIEQKVFAIYFYVLFVVFMVVRFFDGLTLSQLHQNPIHAPRVDPVVWLVQWLGVPDIFAAPLPALVFDMLIIGFPILILIRLVLKKSISKLVIFHILLFLLYVLVIYCYPTLSIRKYLGLALLPIAFIFTKKSRYENYLQLMRYYVCFIFVSASLWKLLRGVAWNQEHMLLTLKSQHIDNIINWPDHFVSTLVQYFISSPSLCVIILIAAILSQLSFIIGFFTRRFDWILAILLVIFIISDFLIMKIEYWEFIVFLPLCYRFKSKV